MFGLNDEYHWLNGKVTREEKIIITTTVRCGCYEIGLNLFNPPKFTKPFLKLVEKLKGS